MKSFLRHSVKLVLLVLGVYTLLFIAPLNSFGHSNTCMVQGAVKISAKSITIAKGSTYKLKVSGTSRKITWSTSKKSVATVKNGVVTAKKAGSATITAKVGSKKYKCKVTVHNYKINTKSVTMTKGSTYTLKITGTSQKKTYTSSKPSIATVNKTTGVITAKKTGTTTITAKVGKVKFYVTVKIEAPSLNKTKLTLKPGNGCQLTLKTSRSIKWWSSDTSVARVSNKGYVTGYRSGKTNIYAKISDKTYTCVVTVNTPSVVNLPSVVTVSLGNSVSYKITAGDGFWLDSDKDYVTCSLTPATFHAGDSVTLTIKGEMVGTDTLTFSGANGWKKTVKVNVTGNSIATTTSNSTINQIAINQFSAYKGVGSKPWICINGTVTNHNNNSLAAIEIQYTFYDASKKAIASYIYPINEPSNGKSYNFSHSFNGSTNTWTSQAQSVEITYVDCILEDSDTYILMAF